MARSSLGFLVPAKTLPFRSFLVAPLSLAPAALTLFRDTHETHRRLFDLNSLVLLLSANSSATIGVDTCCTAGYFYYC